MRVFVRLPSAVYRLPAQVLFLAAAAALAQSTGAKLTHEQKPVYPENLLNAQKQGNVLLIGRIDTRGKVQDIHPVATTNEQFVEPAVAAVRAWQFRPATRDGKPVEVAANIVLRFRLQSEKRGEIARPTLGDLAVFPADAAGKKTAPEGFPIRRGADPRLAAEALLDVTPMPQDRTLSIQVEAVSPKGRSIPLVHQSLAVPAKAADGKIRFTVPIGRDWEDGVWMIRFQVDKVDAGVGQFWLAGDPTRFNFAGAMPKT